MKQILYIIGIILLVSACSSIDCPLNNVVYAKYKLMGDVTTLDEPLTVATKKADGTDTILLNLMQQADSFEIPVSYGLDADELYFERIGEEETRRDTIWIEKTNEPHFESVDCGVNYFHTITGVRYTRNDIDSVTINNRNVTYDNGKAHIFIYYRQ